MIERRWLLEIVAAKFGIPPEKFTSQGVERQTGLSYAS